MVKQLRQVAGVEKVKVIDYKKGIFAVTPSRGATLSEEVLRTAVKNSGFTAERILPPQGVAQEKPSAPAPHPSEADTETTGEEAEQILDEAKDAFLAGRYNDAARLARRAAVEMPRVARAKQFLALAFFAEGDYEKAASAARTALHLGSAWKWKTLSQFYSDPQQYTRHLRALEKQVREKPTLARLRFLLGYHYLMLGHLEAARAQLTLAKNLDPKNELLGRLLKQWDEKGKTPRPNSAANRKKN